jgi:hypothetical protein
MNKQVHRIARIFLLLTLGLGPAMTAAQVAVPEIEEIQEIPVISRTEIDELVGVIALYPDDLLAIVLPAATFPLQVVEAGRFLAELESDPSLEPDEDWDDSIVALLNYPEVIELMNEDLDWTWRLGEAVVGQQSDVIAAIEGFRDQAYAAGNLKSDEYQVVAEEEGAIQITPVQEDVIYVPYYEPSEVVVYQPRPVYFYYPRPYPVYYYPYPAYYSFHDHFRHHWFWGVTTAFSIAWPAHHVSVYHHSFAGHPYYGRTYRDRWWYRQPDIHIHNNVYVRNNINTSNTRYRKGDYWLPSNRRTVSYADQRITRTRYYSNSTSTARPSRESTNSTTRVVRKTNGSTVKPDSITIGRGDEREKIEFRARSTTATSSRSATIQPTAKPTARSQPSVTRSSIRNQSQSPRPIAKPQSSAPRPTAKPKPSSHQAVQDQSRSRPSIKPSTSKQTATVQTSSRQSKAQPSSRPKAKAQPSKQSAKPRSAKSTRGASGSRSTQKKEH